MSRADVRRLLVAYDIPADARRSRLAKALSAYGDRVQYSVFVVDAAPVRIARLRRRLEDIMVEEEDSVLMCDLGPATGVAEYRFTTLGRQRAITHADSSSSEVA